MINFKPSFKTTILTFACVFQFVGNLPTQADDFDLEDVDLKNHARLYNSLPSAKKSNDLLEKSSTQFKSFFKDAEKIVNQYELESSIGLRLIHKHFTLGEGQLMGENYEIVKTIPSLVTQPHTLEEAQTRGGLPASWIFTDNPEEGGVLFEASSDPAIKVSNIKLQKNPEFFKEMGNLLRGYKLNNLLSIAILERDNLIAKENQLYMENTYFSSNRSVVQLWNIQEKPFENFVRTSWGFEGPTKHGCRCSTTWVCHPDDGCWGIHEHSTENIDNI